MINRRRLPPPETLVQRMLRLEAEKEAKRKGLTQARVRELFDYDPETGKLYWKVNRSSNVSIGNEAGYIGGWGYRTVSIDDEKYKSHNIIWLWVYGYLPEAPYKIVDHIDFDPNNNKLSNLRLVSKSDNTFHQRLRLDNTSGHAGVCLGQRDRRWFAYINQNYRRVYLGWFDTIEDAIAARKAAELKYYGHLFDNPTIEELSVNEAEEIRMCG